MRHGGLAAGTVRARHYQLRRWSKWIGAAWRDATWRDVEAWVAARDLGPSSASGTVSHLRAFYRWARREGLADGVDPCADVVSPRIPARLPRPVRDHDVARAVGPCTARPELACALMAYAGLRCCEVARLRWSDVDLERCLLFVKGKGDRDAAVPFGPTLRTLLAAQPDTDGPVIASTRGFPLRADTISHMVGQHLRRLDIDASAHQLRHYAATTLLERCGNVIVVRDFLRHASVATTEIYSRLSPTTVIAAVADW